MRTRLTASGTLGNVHSSAGRRAALFGAAMATLCGACTGPVGIPPDPTGPPPGTHDSGPTNASVPPGTAHPGHVLLSGLWVQRYPELTRRIAADRNFELASHSSAH
ncbi:MAG TPA: hypothetical protein VIQ30_05775 [Pseudonocardia sp.]